MAGARLGGLGCRGGHGRGPRLGLPLPVRTEHLLCCWCLEACKPFPSVKRSELP